MSFGIYRGWNKYHSTKAREIQPRFGYPYVGIDVYGPRRGSGGGPVDLSELGRALGTLYRAVDAVLAFDPYGLPSIRYKPLSDEYGERAHLVLEFKASSDDVVTGGPLHFNRAARCHVEMYRVLEAEFDERARTR